MNEFVNNMNNQEEKLKAEIRTLFFELIEEEKERFDIDVKRTIYPSNHTYVNKANELYDKAFELEKLNSKYSTFHLKDVLSTEVDMVNRHKYMYKNGRVLADSISELQNLMRKATRHIQLYYFNILGDIKIE